MEKSESLQQKNIYLTSFSNETEESIRSTVIVDSVQKASMFADFLNDFFNVISIVSIGSDFIDSEIVYANEAFYAKEKPEE